MAMGSVYALSGVGLVVLYRATATLNFAYGAIGAVGALAAWDLIESGVPKPLAWVACIAVSTLLSLAYGMIVSPKLTDRDLATKAISTVGFMLFVLGFGLWLWPDIPRSLRLPTSEYGFWIFGVRVVVTKVIALGLAIGVAIGVGQYVKHTRSGLHMRAMADDPDFSDMLGIRIDRVGAIAWGISGALAGVSALLIADLVRLEIVALSFLVVPAIAAAILGRMTSLAGAAIGGIAIGVAEALLAPFETVSAYRGAVPFVVAILFLMLRQRETVLPSLAVSQR